MFADSRPHFQADVAVAEHDRQEVDLRAELLEFDRGGAQALRHRIGNSPPTLNWAGRPLTATMFGSARILAMFRCCSASRKPKNALLPSTMPNSSGLAAAVENGMNTVRNVDVGDQAADAG